jgi:hypothetical protein
MERSRIQEKFIMRFCSRATAVLVFALASFSALAQTPDAKQPGDPGAPRVESAPVPFETELLRVQQSAAMPRGKATLKSEALDANGNLAGTGGTVGVDGAGGAGVWLTAAAATPSVTTKLGAVTTGAQWAVLNPNQFPLIWSEATGATKMAIPATFNTTYGASGTAALTFWHSTNSNYTIWDVYGGSNGNHSILKLTNAESTAYVATLGLYKDGIIRSSLSASMTAPSYFMGSLAVGKGTVGPNVTLDVQGTLHADTVTAENGIKAVYQDLAEWVPATGNMEAGTVVVVSPNARNEVSPSSYPYQTSVAGVISANPGVLLGRPGDDKAKVATTGRVKVKVDASHDTIRPGDLLVTSGKPGFAMKSQPVSIGGIEMHRPGTLVGKALEPLEAGEGEILVLLSLQ